MSLSRRDFLKLGALTAVSVTTSAACSAAGRYVAQQDLPDTLVLPDEGGAGGETAVLHRLLNRAGYGPRPGDLQQATTLGLVAYLEQQLDPASLDDTAADLLIGNLTLYYMDSSQLFAQDERDAARELIAATILRPLYSKRQLYEAMVEFWSDHFNIYLRKDPVMPFLKLLDDRDVIRPHALGKFRDLLFASAQSPAMLVYLDNIRNEKGHPNENYARELMELHTLGVHGGYSQQDVQEVARMLTGWGVGRRNSRREGQFVFHQEQHDFAAKTVLGRTFPAGQGEAEVWELLEMLVTHPATAQFIATKLVRRFVADEPPPALVAQVAQTYQQTDGDIKSMLRVIFLSQEFASAPPKLKRPFSFFISTLRALHTDMNIRLGSSQSRAISRWLEMLGQMPFNWPPPNGYPDVSAAWAANLMPRWNLALALLHNEFPGATVPLDDLLAAGGATTGMEALQGVAGMIYGRSLTPTELQPFTTYLSNTSLPAREASLRLRDATALLVAGPAFQWT